MNVLVDTNVVLDVLLDRRPFADAATRLLVLVERGLILACLGATTVTTIHYLASRVIGDKSAKEEVAKLLTLFDVAPVTRAVLEDALRLSFDDFEDAVLHEAARHAGLHGIVTRDRDGFAKATLPVYDTDEILKIVSAAP